MQFYADDKPVIDKVKNKKEITELCHVCKHARIWENGGVRMVEGCEKGMVVCDDFEAIGSKRENLKEISAVVKVDTKELDATIEKVNHLTELLKEAQQISHLWDNANRKNVHRRRKEVNGHG